MIKKNLIEILKKYYINHYNIIEENNELLVDSNYDVNLNFLKEEELPIKFRIVKGKFYCQNSNLKTLKNSPIECLEFYCDNNIDLESLKYSPIKTNILSCINCKIKSLEYSPKFIKKIILTKNKYLETLEGLSDNIEEIIADNCINLKTIKGLPNTCKRLSLYNSINIDKNEFKKYLPEKIDILYINRLYLDIIMETKKIINTIIIFK